MKMLSQNENTDENTAVALGIFDGVHIGHREIISRTIALSEGKTAPCVFTFRTESVGKKHGKNYEFIYPDSRKNSILETLGIKYIYSPSVSDVQNMSGEEFAEKILSDKLHAKTVVCGENFRFGKNAACGSGELLQLGRKLGFDVEICPLVKVNGKEISSEIIRDMLRNGDMKNASVLLGEDYFTDALVVGGNRIGRTISFPTINQLFECGQLVPRRGVYASVTYIDGKKYPSVTNVGVKPTVEKNISPLAETNIINFSGDLYGRKIKVGLYGFIRDEQKFSSLDELKKRINRDVHTAQEMYAAQIKF